MIKTKPQEKYEEIFGGDLSGRMFTLYVVKQRN